MLAASGGLWLCRAGVCVWGGGGVQGTRMHPVVGRVAFTGVVGSSRHACRCLYADMPAGCNICGATRSEVSGLGCNAAALLSWMLCDGCQHRQAQFVLLHVLQMGLTYVLRGAAPYCMQGQQYDVRNAVTKEGSITEPPCGLHATSVS